MLPAQILLNNFLYDVSQVALPTDNVDQDLLDTPQPWDIKFIKEFIIFLGPVSSIFDFLTFWMMIAIFHAPQSLFHTGWFVESLLTQTFVIYIIRTKKIPFLESRPSKALLFTTIGIVLLGILLPYLPVGKYLGFVPLPAVFFLLLAGIAVGYLILTQLVKVWFVRRYGYE
jgi:Mg2+-importing ATPase